MLATAYEALGRGDSGPLLELLGPEAAGLDGFAFEVAEVIEAGDRMVVTGVMRQAELELDFAHVWELEEEEPVRVRAYFDRSRLTGAATKRQLADVADDLLEQAAEIRRQWARLADALRAAGVEAAADEDDDAEVPAGSASVRLAAVDMAQDGATREEVEASLRDEFGVEDPEPILEEVFGAPGAEALGERAAELEATRLSRLFSRK